MRFTSCSIRDISVAIVGLLDQVFFGHCYCNYRNSLNLSMEGCSCILNSGGKRDVNNDENQYNHNFDGLYCWCNSTYNDQENIMYQCVLCTDWYHYECIEKRVKIFQLANLINLSRWKERVYLNPMYHVISFV